MDFRVKSTLNSIDEALIRLIKEKPISKITVRELCVEAEINRATYYRHFKDIPDLIAKTENALLASFEKELELRTEGPLNIEDMMVFVCECIKADGRRYGVLFSENGDPGFLNDVFAIAYKYSKSNVEGVFPELTELQRKWLFSYVANGCSAIWREWIASNMEQLPQDVAKFVTTLILKGANGLHPCDHVKDGILNGTGGIA